jgi:hypothetical protein
MFRIRYGSKYGSKTKEYNGRLYHSRKEAKYAQELDLLKKAGEILDWKPQFRLNLAVNGYHITTYIADFLVTAKDGTEEIHEVKGFQTQLFNIKWKLCEAIYSKKYKMVIIHED